MLRLHATRPEDLERITGEIHDWFFDVDDVEFDPHRSEVVVPFRRWSSDEAKVIQTATRSPFQRLLKIDGRTQWEAPWYRWMLRIGDATTCELVDKARIGIADFNGVEYDAHAGVLTIEGNIPVTISIGVRRLDVSVEETDEMIGLARYTTWPGGADSYSGSVLPLQEERRVKSGTSVASIPNGGLDATFVAILTPNCPHTPDSPLTSRSSPGLSQRRRIRTGTNSVPVAS